MSHLPVPELDDTLSRYLTIVRPLLSEEEFACTQAVVARFAEHDGPAAQAALRRRAAESNDAGVSWLTDLWLATYLGGRDPLPLSSNVGFELTWRVDDSGVERAARLAHRLARVHLRHVRDEIEAMRSARGELLCMRQWSYLAGGIRRPRAGQDEIVPGSDDPTAREVIVLFRGRAHAVQVSNADGVVVSRSALQAALTRIVESDDDGSADSFAAWSYLGSEDAARYETLVLADAHNAAVYGRLVGALFVLTLTDADATAPEHLRAVAFEHGVAWPSKPVTYVVSLVDDFVGMHIEHTVADGGTLSSVVELAQRLDDENDENDENGDTALRVPVEALAWRLTPEVQRTLAGDVAAYARHAGTFRVRPVRTAAITSSTIKVSADALQQFVMLFAQLRTYGYVRSTYESVDMRQYQAGRTEAMRPCSAEAITLARALVDGCATADLLRAALDEHKHRVVACKSGNGVDRHLLGLRAMAAELGLSTEMFGDTGYARLTTDFLSTTSLGTDEQIARYAFAPTSDGGIGVCYTRRAGGADYEFVLTYDTTRATRVDAFAGALVDGVDALAGVVAASR